MFVANQLRSEALVTLTVSPESNVAKPEHLSLPTLAGLAQVMTELLAPSPECWMHEAHIAPAAPVSSSW